MHLSKDVRILSEGLVAIIGGSGGMGKLMARLLKNLGAPIRLCGRDIRKVKYAAKRMGLKHGKLEDVKDADILILSVPFEEVLNVFKPISQRLKHNSLIIDISSVKTPLVNQLASFISDEMEYLSLHPLFGPSTRKFMGQKMLIVEVKEGPKSKALKEYLKGLGLIFTLTTPEENDRMMAITQVLHHFPLISLSKILTETPIPEGFESRSFSETLKVIRRMSKNWKTIVEIQKYNPYAAAMRERYMETVSQLLSMQGPTVKAIKNILKGFRETYPS